MSRHLFIDRPDCQVVLGYDHMLQSFFGQVFDPSSPRRAGIAIDGWPTKSGLGTRRPVRTVTEARNDVTALLLWVQDLQLLPPAAWSGAEVPGHLQQLREILLHESYLGEDFPSPELPPVLREPAR